MILLSNDDGIYNRNIWDLAKELKTIAEIGIVAPTSQMSAVGTHLTLRAPIRINEFPDQIKQDIPCYAETALRATVSWSPMNIFSRSRYPLSSPASTTE